MGIKIKFTHRPKVGKREKKRPRGGEVVAPPPWAYLCTYFLLPMVEVRKKTYAPTCGEFLQWADRPT